MSLLEASQLYNDFRDLIQELHDLELSGNFDDTHPHDNFFDLDSSA